MLTQSTEARQASAQDRRPAKPSFLRAILVFDIRSGFDPDELVPTSWMLSKDRHVLIRVQGTDEELADLIVMAGAIGLEWIPGAIVRLDDRVPAELLKLWRQLHPSSVWDFIRRRTFDAASRQYKGPKKCPLDLIGRADPEGDPIAAGRWLACMFHDTRVKQHDARRLLATYIRSMPQTKKEMPAEFDGACSAGELMFVEASRHAHSPDARLFQWRAAE